MKVIFMGTPDFGVLCLKALIASHHKVVAVISQPDKPAGRGKKIEFSPIKKVALANNIPVLQYRKVSLEGVNDITALQPDIMITAAYGQILKQCILDIPKYGIINVHASLLPKFRGAAPIQWAVIKGATESGVTIMKTELGLDTGAIIEQKHVPVGEKETAGELYKTLSEIAPELLLKALDEIENGTVKYIPQDNEKMSFYPMIHKEDATINFNQNAEDIVNFVRGMNPSPTACTIYNGKLIKVLEAKVSDLYAADYKSAGLGQVIVANYKQGLHVKCLDGAVELVVIQAENGKRMAASQFLLGNKIELNVVLGANNG